MKEHGIMFSAPMIFAIQQKKKTMTSRLITSPLNRVEIGDKLWVRENFWDKVNGQARSTFWAAGLPHGFNPREKGYRLRPSIHMPKWLTRFVLTVKDVKRRRVTDMTGDEFLMEGIFRGKQGFEIPGIEGRCWTKARFAFIDLWDGLHKKEGERWEDDPEIVSLIFEAREGGL